jgi:hypothetical protein
MKPNSILLVPAEIRKFHMGVIAHGAAFGISGNGIENGCGAQHMSTREHLRE